VGAWRTALASGPSRGSDEAASAVSCFRRLCRSPASSVGCHPWCNRQFRSLMVIRRDGRHDRPAPAIRTA